MLRNILFISGILLSGINVCFAQGPQKGPLGKTIFTNEKYINGLNTNIDVADHIQVFDHVFQMLDTMVTVYPTENYFYFEATLAGRNIKGNIALFANICDSGIISFAYQDKGGACEDCPTNIDKVTTITSQDGMDVQKITDFKYVLTFHEKRVLFILNDVGLSSPLKLNLGANEEYVGTTYDESGMKFNLLFDNKNKNLFWTLNQEDDVPEVFIPYTDDLVLGQRSEFFFYLDKELDRKVLVAVKKDNIDQNNWFDGPFDQLPDNYIKTDRINLKKYLEQSFPNYAGKIDKYGNFLDDPSNRIAITSYLIYNNRQEVLKVYFANHNSFKNHSDFLYNMTQTIVFEAPALTKK